MSSEPDSTTFRRRSGRMLESTAPRRVRRRRALARRRLTVKKLAQIAQSGKPIVAGPWIGGVGMELLYWIPLLNWLTTEGGVDPARIVAVSRGGADPWYAQVAGAYVDLLDHYDPGVIRKWHEARLLRPPDESRIGVHTHDREAFELARELTGESHAEWLHPVVMHRMFAPRWEWGASNSLVASHTDQRPLPENENPPRLELPEQYVAVKPYFSACFPNTDSNRAAIERIVTGLAEQASVVLLRADEEMGGHEPFVPDSALPAVDVSGQIAPRHNLAAQTQIVRAARALVSTYGGFSYLGPYVGTPTLAVYSTARFPIAHLETIDSIWKRLAVDRKRLFRARHIQTLAAGAEEE